MHYICSSIGDFITHGFLFLFNLISVNIGLFVSIMYKPSSSDLLGFFVFYNNFTIFAPSLIVFWKFTEYVAAYSVF